jgi:hypothetical protein
MDFLLQLSVLSVRLAFNSPTLFLQFLKLSPNFIQRTGWTGARISIVDSASAHDDKVIKVSAGQGQRKTKKGGIQELRSAREKLNNKREGLQLNAGRRPTEAIINRAHDFH